MVRTSSVSGGTDCGRHGTSRCRSARTRFARPVGGKPSQDGSVRADKEVGRVRFNRSRREALDQFSASLLERLGAEHGDPTRGETVGTRLGDLLVAREVITEEQRDAALAAQAGSGRRMGEVLVGLQMLTTRDIAMALAAQRGLPTIDLARYELDDDVVGRLPATIARDLRSIPLAVEGERVHVACADPLLDDLEARLIEALEAPIALIVAAEDEVQWALDHCYRSNDEIHDALRDFEARAEERRRNHADTTESSTVEVDENAPVVKVVNLILERAVADRASDVHIEPQADGVRVRARTDGALHELLTLPASMASPLVSRIKVLADMNIVERRRPQDGQMQMDVSGRALDIRVATSSTVFGEMCVLRLLDKSKAFFALSELGMPADTTTSYRDLIRSPYGMVVCAGPTGSGKTTTLYATLAEVNDDAIKVTTIEDPVEYVIPSINQIQINEQAGVTFASGLRAILRQDPDSILVGEIRDVETARIAVQAALTGHFVMSSLHATDASSALHRFLDMGIEPFLLASSLLGVVGQRLVRRNCPRCVEPYVPTVEELAFFERGGGVVETAQFARGAGCNFCGHTGHYERTGVYEVLAVTDEIREQIVNGASHGDIRAVAQRQGMRTLRDQAIRLVAEGSTTVAEVLRTVYVL
jgi:type IV pilus assembly protein PilB